jgi:hypothetical protein
MNLNLLCLNVAPVLPKLQYYSDTGLKPLDCSLVHAEIHNDSEHSIAFVHIICKDCISRLAGIYRLSDDLQARQKITGPRRESRDVRNCFWRFYGEV